MDQDKALLEKVSCENKILKECREKAGAFSLSFVFLF